MSLLHHFVFYIGVYFSPYAPHPQGSGFVLMDGQPNRPPISDVFRAAVHGLLSCLCLDHRALRVGEVKDISIEGRHELLVRPHLV